MAGRHSKEGAGGNSGLRFSITTMISDLEQQIVWLTTVRQEARLVGARILALESRNQDLAITGGALINNLPENIEDIITGIRIHIRTLEEYRDNIL